MPDFVLRSEVRSQSRGNSAAAFRILSSFGRPLETGGRGDQTRPARRPLRAHGSMGPRGLVEIMLHTSRLQQRWRIPWHIILIYHRHSYILSKVYFIYAGMNYLISRKSTVVVDTSPTSAFNGSRPLCSHVLLMYCEMIGKPHSFCNQKCIFFFGT